MADWSTWATAALTGGGGAAAVAFVQFLFDERRKRAVDRQAEEDRPLETQVTQLGLVDRATLIQQRAIEALEEQVEDQKVRYSIYKQETDQRIAGLEEKIEELQASLEQKDAYIGRLQGVVSSQELELRGYRSAASP